MRFLALLATPLLLFGATLEEKVEELFVLPLVPSHAELVAKQKCGGVIVQPGQTEEIQRALKLVKEDSLVFVDAERGIGMRCRDFPNLPRALTLAASGCDLEEIGRFVGDQCRALGAKICLGPVVDCVHHPKNPIGLRGFSSDPDTVAKKATAFWQGLKSTGIMACAKHFPGHGATHVDSHEELPTIYDLQERDLAPFRHLIGAGIESIMIGHLAVPQLEKRPFFSATMSKPIIQAHLKEFRGLIVSDALNMMALRNHFTPEEVALHTFEAGVDVFLFGGYPKAGVDLVAYDEGQKTEIERIINVDFPKMKKALVKAFKEGRFEEEELDRRLAKIHALKQERLKPSTLSLSELKERTLSMRKDLFARAITLVRDPKNRLPTTTKKFYVITNGNPELGKRFKELLHAQDEKEGAQVVIAQFGVDVSKKDFGIPQELASYKGSIFVLFGNPYGFQALCCCITQIAAYEPEIEAVEAAAAYLLGESPAQGTLPINI